VNPRVKLLGMAKLLQQRGLPIPLDMLVQADELGLSLARFDQPQQHLDHEGEDAHGTESYVSDAERHG